MDLNDIIDSVNVYNVGSWYSDTEWKRETLDFVKEIIDTNILYDKNDKIIKEKYYTFIEKPSNNIEILSAFVSETVDPKYNYQTLEKLGDNAIEIGVIKNLYDIDGQNNLELGPDGINNYVTKYVSKKQFGMIGDKLKLKTRTKFNQKETIDLSEDLFEAFCGAIYSSGENFAHGFGHYMCKQLAKTIMGPGFLDIRYTKEEYMKAFPADTWIKEIFQALGGKDESKQCYRGYRINDDFYHKFILTGKLLDFVNSVSKKNYNEKVLADTMGDPSKTLKESEKKVSELARKVLIENGIDFELKIKLEFNMFLNKLERLYGLSKTEKDKLLKKIKERNVIAVKIKKDIDKDIIYLNEVMFNSVGLNPIKQVKYSSSRITGLDHNEIIKKLILSYI